MYEVFFDAVRLDGPISAEHPIPATRREIVEDYFPLIKEHREFLGVIDTTETTLQLMYDADEGKYWVEVPTPIQQGSYGAWLEYGEAYALLSELPPVFSLDEFPAFAFQPWR